MRKFSVSVTAAAAAAALAAAASPTMADLAPFSTFGGGDGWFAPGEGGYGFLGTVNNERGIAYNPATGNLLLVSRTGGVSVRILNGQTGVETGTMNVDSTVITGGTFALSMIGAGTDGAIYAANLTTNATTSPYKIYRWANEGAAPTVAFSGAPLAGARFGDTFDVHGGGTNTLLASGPSNTPVVAGNNGYAILSTANGSDYTSSMVAFPGTPPNAGDFRLGMSFVDADTVLGRVGGVGNPLRVTDYVGTAGTLVASPTLINGSAERLMDVAFIDGKTFLAIQSTGDSFLRVYDITDPSNPIFYDSGTTTSGALIANANGVGQVKWGALSANGGVVYAMSTNHGIQAFQFTIPEPATAGVLALAAAGLVARRGRRA
jgi:hypothetical protein